MGPSTEAAEQYGVESPSNLLKQEMIFGILKKLAEKDQAIYGEGVLEVPAFSIWSSSANVNSSAGVLAFSSRRFIGLWGLGGRERKKLSPG